MINEELVVSEENKQNLIRRAIKVGLCPECGSRLLNMEKWDSGNLFQNAKRTTGHKCTNCNYDTVKTYYVNTSW